MTYELDRVELQNIYEKFQNRLQFVYQDNEVTIPQENLQLIVNTTEDLIGMIDEFEITPNDTSVKTAREVSVTMGKLVDIVNKGFDTHIQKYEKNVKYLKNCKKMIVQPIKNKKDYMDDGVRKAKEEWKKEIIHDLQRDVEVELNIEQFKDIKPTLTDKKEKLKEKMETRVYELEKAFQEQQTNAQMIKMFCERYGESEYTYIELLKVGKPLAEIITLIESNAQKRKETEQRLKDVPKVEQDNKIVTNEKFYEYELVIYAQRGQMEKLKEFFTNNNINIEVLNERELV